MEVPTLGHESLTRPCGPDREFKQRKFRVSKVVDPIEGLPIEGTPQLGSGCDEIRIALGLARLRIGEGPKVRDRYFKTLERIDKRNSRMGLTLVDERPDLGSHFSDLLRCLDACEHRLQITVLAGTAGTDLSLRLLTDPRATVGPCRFK
jgi:hypothetical protein